MFAALWTWLMSLITGPATQQAVAGNVTDAATTAPAKAVSIVHAMLAELATHEQDHPILLHMTNWIDELIQQKGEAVLTGLEKAALAALAVKYPALAPFLALPDRPAQTPPQS
jgi:hypothetical protein